MRQALVMFVCAVLLTCGVSYAESDTAQEVKEAILEGVEYTAENLKGQPDSYSKDGAIEFWSSGGLMQEIPAHGRFGDFEAFAVQPKHIKVLTLVEGQAAVAHYYMEGFLKPKGLEAVPHYMTRVTQVYVKEDGRWKIRSSHWSPLAGGSGTSQTAPRE